MAQKISLLVYWEVGLWIVKKIPVKKKKENVKDVSIIN